MEIIIDYLKRPFIKRIFVLLIIGIVLFFVRNLITLFLLTFIFIYLINSTQKFICRLLRKFMKINREVIVISLYVFVVGLLFLLIYTYVPVIIQQITDIITSVTYFMSNYDVLTKTNNMTLQYIYNYLEKIDIQGYINNSGSLLISVVSNAGSVSINVIIAMVLSLFFLLEKEKIVNFSQKFETSKIYWIYDELRYFGVKFMNSFGKVIQTQILISCINAVLSFIILTFLQFPNTVGLFILILALGMVPVAGVFISVVPLSVIAYNIGGINYIAYVLILIVILHALEGYILNPKLMSHHTKLPVFITFLILIIWERLIGAWGLIVGIPITMFFLDVLEVETDCI